MAKYRGTRGRRDYIQEAAELKKPAKILATLCLAVFAAAGVLFAYSWAMGARETARAAAVVAVFAETSALFDGAENSDEPDKPPIVALNWGAGIFFDTYASKMIFPPDFDAFEFEEGFYRRNFYFTFDDVDFSRGFVPLMQFDGLPLYILREYERLTLRAERGAITRHGNGEDYSYIAIVDPREIYRTIIVLDAGHGGRDPGAPSFHRGGPYEADIVLAISEMVLEIFDAPDILIIPTRRGDYSMSTAARTQIANAIGDYFISIHCNANARSRLSNGTLTLYGDADGSRELAEVFQYALLSALGSRDMGITHAPQFHILRHSQVPVVILELLFQSNPEDATRLADTAVQMLIAETIAEVIVELPPVR